jgi:hypothetical protein
VSVEHEAKGCVRVTELRIHPFVETFCNVHLSTR